MSNKTNTYHLPLVTEEDLKEGHRNWMNELRSNPNNFSFWFPFVKDLKIRGLMVPKSVVVDCPEEVAMSFFMEKEGDGQRIDQWVSDKVVPAVKENFLSGEIFIKNGCFSDKYTFGNACHVKDAFDIRQLTKQIIRIQNDSLCLETGGNLELVIRHMETLCRTMDSVEGLAGIWSVDFILEDDRVCLIDMAQGHRSAYWDAERVKRMFPDRYRNGL